jgi:hypothetical protein
LTAERIYREIKKQGIHRYGCMHRAFEYIGGVPSEILFDNAKTVVSERVGGLVRFNENLLWLAATYGFTPKACWTNDPESKGKVESSIKYVKRDFYYGCSYNGLGDLNRQALEWCNEVANCKIHSTTGEVPFERLAEERSYLHPRLSGLGASLRPAGNGRSISGQAVAPRSCDSPERGKLQNPAPLNTTGSTNK